MKKKLILVVLCLGLIICGSANASITYEFTATSAANYWDDDLTIPASFTLTVADFISSNTYFPLASLDQYSISTTYSISGQSYVTPVQFAPNLNNYGYDVILIGDTYYSYGYYFPIGAFSATGTYATYNVGTTADNIAILKVSQSGAPVPIPAAVWLLGSGLIGLFGLRRRFQK